MKEKIVVVTVTYNDYDYLEKQLTHLRAQTYPLYKVVVVDNNSNEENRAKLSAQADDLIDIMWLSENLGGAGGFEAGMKYAFKKYSPDWIWIMDADAFPNDDCLNSLLSCNRINEKTGIVAPIIYGVDLKEYQLYHLKKIPKYLYRDEFAFSKYEDIGDDALIDADAFVGPLVSKKVIDELGFPDGKLFIYGDDLEYTYRISRKYEIVLVKKAIINHRDQPVHGQQQPKNWWKDYYMFRNRYLFIDEFSKKKIIKYIGRFLLTMRVIKKIIICAFNNYSFKMKKIYIKTLLRAIKDGTNGYEGKAIDPVEFKVKIDDLQNYG